MDNVRTSGPQVTDDKEGSMILKSEGTKYWDFRLSVEVVDNRYGNAARIFPHGGLGGSRGRLLRYLTSWQCGGTSDGETG